MLERKSIRRERSRILSINLYMLSLFLRCLVEHNDAILIDAIFSKIQSFLAITFLIKKMKIIEITKKRELFINLCLPCLKYISFLFKT